MTNHREMPAWLPYAIFSFWFPVCVLFLWYCCQLIKGLTPAAGRVEFLSSHRVARKGGL